MPPAIAGGIPGIPCGMPPGIFSASFCHLFGRRHAAAEAHHLREAGHRAAPLPPPIAFIMSAMPRCILSSLLMSSALVPEPAAMRFLRLALSMSGLLALAAASSSR